MINANGATWSRSSWEKLNNVLYINLHGVEVQEQCTELTATGTDGDVAKVKMFVVSEKGGETGRITPCGSTLGRSAMLDFLGESGSRILRVWICAIITASCGSSRVSRCLAMQTRLHYLSSFWDFF